MKYIVDHKKILEVPLIEVYNIDTEEIRPILFILHGSGQPKEHLLIDAYMFAKEGFFVVMFDACGHGELKNMNVIESSKHDILNRYSNYKSTSNNLNLLIRHYANDIHADAARVGLIGFSLGAYNLFYNITNERLPSIKAAIPVSGNPFWSNGLREQVKKIPDLEQKYGDAIINEIESYLRSIEPASNLHKLIDVPILMLNGENDEGIPIDGVRSFSNELKGIYTNSQFVEFIEFKGFGHRLPPPEVYKQALSWLKKYV